MSRTSPLLFGQENDVEIEDPNLEPIKKNREMHQSKTPVFQISG